MEPRTIGTMAKTTIKLLSFCVLIVGVSIHANPSFFGQQASVGASASDNFDSYSDGVDLGAQANWATVEGNIRVDKPSSDGRVRGDALQNDVCRRTSPSFSANQEAEITIVLGDGNGAIGLAVRCQIGADTYYACHWDDSANAIYLAYVSTGTWHQISTTSKSYSTGNKLRLEATGTGSATRLTLKEDTGSGWVNVFTSVDPGTYIDGGQPGVYGYYINAAYLHGDNWSASDL